MNLKKWREELVTRPEYEGFGTAAVDNKLVVVVFW